MQKLGIAFDEMGRKPQLNKDLVKDTFDSLFLAESKEQTAVALPPSLAQEF